MLEELLQKIQRKNELLFPEQEIINGEVPERILMIDQETWKPISPLMKEFYAFAISWECGLIGKSSIDPSNLPALYKDPKIHRLLDLTAENFGPLPPSEPSDWNRTALFAKEPEDLDINLFWWENDNDTEPAIISISGGDIKVFSDMIEFLEYLADGTFPEKGDAIYSMLEETREF